MPLSDCGSGEILISVETHKIPKASKSSTDTISQLSKPIVEFGKLSKPIVEFEKQSWVNQWMPLRDFSNK